MLCRFVVLVVLAGTWDCPWREAARAQLAWGDGTALEGAMSMDWGLLDVVVEVNWSREVVDRSLGLCNEVPAGLESAGRDSWDGDFRSEVDRGTGSLDWPGTGSLDGRGRPLGLGWELGGCELFSILTMYRWAELGGVLVRGVGLSSTYTRYESLMPKDWSRASVLRQGSCLSTGKVPGVP